MLGSDLYISLTIGVALSLIYAEKTKVLPAGIIVPGYLALVFDQPVFVGIVLIISLLTYIVVIHGIGRITLIYGRRKFAAMMAVGMAMKLLFDYFYPLVPFEAFELRGIGIIVPGLIANSIAKQGVLPTTGSTLLISGLTFIIMFVYNIL